MIIIIILLTGKGDLVGSDISLHLQYTSNCQIGALTTSVGSDLIIKSSSDVRALTYCDLKCIHMPGLVEVLRLYPEYQQEFANDIKHDLTYNVREGYEAEVQYSIFNYFKVVYFSYIVFLCHLNCLLNPFASLLLPIVSFC